MLEETERFSPQTPSQKQHRFPKGMLEEMERQAHSERFFAGEDLGLQEYFVYFKITNRTDAGKDPLRVR